MNLVLRKIITQLLKRVPFIENSLRILIKEAQPTSTILLEYPTDPRPRYGYGDPPHQKLYEIIDRNRDVYVKHLKSIIGYKDCLIKIPLIKNNQATDEPSWVNPSIPFLDSATLYTFLSSYNPRRYYEIGSGNSTKFARQAIKDQKLRTTITSIDPDPRAVIDRICDTCIRKPVENVDPGLFDELEEGDILFVDNSHRVFMNSDATVVFIDILPRLKPGVLVEFHDIYLPYDYPIYGYMERKYWSEQYVVAAYLLAEGKMFDVVLPNAFISEDEELSSMIGPLYDLIEAINGQSLGRSRGGASFWIQIN
jgi:Methyltransferase domain